MTFDFMDFDDVRIGTKILDFIKFKFIEKNRTGCAFITVDALKTSTDFYSKKQLQTTWSCSTRARCLNCSDVL